MSRNWFSLVVNCCRCLTPLKHDYWPCTEYYKALSYLVRVFKFSVRIYLNPQSILWGHLSSASHTAGAQQRVFLVHPSKPERPAPRTRPRRTAPSGSYHQWFLWRPFSTLEKKRCSNSSFLCRWLLGSKAGWWRRAPSWLAISLWETKSISSDACSQIPQHSKRTLTSCWTRSPGWART